MTYFDRIRIDQVTAGEVALHRVTIHITDERKLSGALCLLVEGEQARPRIAGCAFTGGARCAFFHRSGGSLTASTFAGSRHAALDVMCPESPPGEEFAFPEGAVATDPPKGGWPLPFISGVTVKNNTGVGVWIRMHTARGFALGPGNAFENNRLMDIRDGRELLL